MTRVARLRNLAIGLAIAVASSTAFAQAVEFLAPEEGAQYREALEAIKAELGARADARSARPRLRIAIGTRALESALATGGGKPDSSPILATLVPRAAFEEALRAHTRPEGRVDPRVASAVFLDQPFARQLALIRIALPERNRIGVLTASGSQDLSYLQSVASAQKFTLVRESVGTAADLYPALRRLLGESDVLLALPDQRVYNSSTIHNILATTFRAQVPLVGFSPAYVRAGALLAVHSSPEQLGRQAGRIAIRVLAGEPLPAPQYPREFAVSVNQTVARSLGLAIDDAASLTTKLAATERE